jgi:hypothetical protein
MWLCDQAETCGIFEPFPGFCIYHPFLFIPPFKIWSLAAGLFPHTAGALVEGIKEEDFSLSWPDMERPSAGRFRPSSCPGNQSCESFHLTWDDPCFHPPYRRVSFEEDFDCCMEEQQKKGG